MNKLQLVLNSDEEQLRKVPNYVRQIIDKHKLNPQISNELLLILSEAIMNAMIHGNKRESNKQVQVNCSFQQPFLHFSVADQGMGFNLKTIDTGITRQKINKEGGRGVLLMQNFCEDIQYQTKRRTLLLKYKVKKY